MKKNKILASVLTFGNTVFAASRAFAQTDFDPKGLLGDIDEGVSTDLAEWLPQVLNMAIGLAALVCVAVLIASGYMYITASGDETKVEKANKSLTNAIIGLVICFISVILVEFVLKNILNQGGTEGSLLIQFFA